MKEEVWSENDHDRETVSRVRKKGGLFVLIVIVVVVIVLERKPGKSTVGRRKSSQY